MAEQDRVRVTFTDFTGSKHADVTLRLDLTADEVIDRLRRANFLPAAETGTTFVLSLKRTNQQLAPNQTLRSVEVKDGDTLIASTMTRGGRSPSPLVR